MTANNTPVWWTPMTTEALLLDKNLRYERQPPVVRKAWHKIGKKLNKKSHQTKVQAGLRICEFPVRHSKTERNIQVVQLNTEKTMVQTQYEELLQNDLARNSCLAGMIQIVVNKRLPRAYWESLAGFDQTHYDHTGHYSMQLAKKSLQDHGWQVCASEEAEYLIQAGYVVDKKQVKAHAWLVRREKRGVYHRLDIIHDAVVTTPLQQWTTNPPQLYGDQQCRYYVVPNDAESLYVSFQGINPRAKLAHATANTCGTLPPNWQYDLLHQQSYEW